MEKKLASYLADPIKALSINAGRGKGKEDAVTVLRQEMALAKAQRGRIETRLPVFRCDPSVEEIVAFGKKVELQTLMGQHKSSPRSSELLRKAKAPAGGEQASPRPASPRHSARSPRHNPASPRQKAAPPQGDSPRQSAATGSGAPPGPGSLHATPPPEGRV